MEEYHLKLESIHKVEQQDNSSEALKKLIAIFEDRKKINKEIEWKIFFLSEDFLKEQYSEQFANGMFQYLSCLHTEDNYTINSLPSRFLLELAVAYALIPKKRQGAFNSKNEKVIYYVNAEGSFYARKKAAEIWNMQKGAYAYPIRILWKPENLVRLYSFSDYIELRNKNKAGLTLENINDWKRLIKNGSIGNIYERNGRGSTIIYEETRSECLITLYTFLIQIEQMPKCILESMYQEYCLKNMEHSSSKNLYAQLKKEILKQYPDIETVLYNPNSKTQMISRWYREFIKMISDHHRNYDIGIYEDTEIMKKQIQSLFEREEWKKLQYDSELFEKMFSLLSNRKVLPETLAKYLISFYSQDKFYNKDKVKQILEGLYQSLGFNRNMKEIDGVEIINYEKTGIEDIDNQNLDFWQYYFQWGFGFRNAALEVGGQKDNTYQKNNFYYLPVYIKDIYYPSLSWQKIFTGFDEKENAILHPNSIEITLIDGNQLKVEFHLHYVLYFFNGEQVLYPLYTFDECMELAKSLEKIEDKFFLLAITRIEKKERFEAVKVIEAWLQKLPLYPLTVPVIARLLAEDNDRDWEREQEQIRAIYYMEQERFCFRVMVYLEQIVIYHQRDFGWKVIKTIYKKEEQEEQKQLALEILNDLKQPSPILIEAVSLEHMEKEEKAEKIVEAWKNYGKYCMEKEGKAPYSFLAFPREEGEISKPAKEFFQKEGQFLTESYCILSYGTQKKNKRIFYCAINPFGFDSIFYSEYQHGLRELTRKIKEKNRVIGHVGWGEVYTKKERFLPTYFAIGESGTYYAFDGIRMIKTENFTELLAKLFDFTKVSLVEIYQGYLSISRFDHRLEYCYSREDFLESIYHMEKTKADFFTSFTKAEMMKELTMQLDAVFHEMPCNMPVLYFQLQKAKGGAYLLDIFGQFILEYDNHNKKEQQKHRKELLGEKKKIVWKLWNHSTARDTMLREFTSFIFYYMENGIYGEKLSHCLKITVGLAGFYGNIKTEQTIYTNRDSILKAIKERTKMTAYSLTMNKKRKPKLFDSKFGGLAYWDIKKEYPSDSNGKKLMLIAQINLDQNPMEALSLPHGMLQFFGSGEEIFCRGFGVKEDQDKFRVVYHNKIDYTMTKEKLQLLGLPDSTDKDKGYLHMPISKELAFDVEKQEVVMGTGDYRFKKELKAAIKQMFSIKIIGSPYFILKKNKIEDEINNAGNWILGYSDFVGKDPRKYKKYKGKLKQYDRQLFQFDVHYLDDSDYYFEHGGCGIAHFFIRSEDLKQKDFSHVMYHWKSCDTGGRKN